VNVAPSRHLTALIVGPLVLAVALYSLTALTGTVWFTLLAGAAAGLVVGALLSRPTLDGVTLCLSGPRRAAVGDLVVSTLHVHNRSERVSPALDLRHQVRGLAEARVHVEPIPPGGRAVVTLSRVALSRGVTESSVIALKAASGLGMLCTHGGGDYHHRLVIHPRRVEVALVEQFGRTTESAEPVRGAGVDISGIREWRPGDSSGNVHWRSSARRGTLVVRERGSAATRNVTVVLACSSSASDWEDVLSVAASACLAAQRAGHRLSLLVWTGGSLASPPVDSAQGLLDWWAGLRASEVPEPAALSRILASIGAADLHVAVSATMPAGPLEEIRRACVAAGGLVHQVTVAM
jgi:uncharacterized protein (DUF58 family)